MNASSPAHCSSTVWTGRELLVWGGWNEPQRMLDDGGRYDPMLDRWQPLPSGTGEALSVEYYNASLDHYFMTADANEVSILDAGIAIPGWQRTGYTFKVYPPESTLGADRTASAPDEGCPRPARPGA